MSGGSPLIQYRNCVVIQEIILHSKAIHNLISRIVFLRKHFIIAVCPKTSEPETQIVEYADWALRQFFEEARKQPWFDNTIFVLEGDHGKLVGDAECELPESYNHIPLMIYSSRIQPEEKTAFGGQVDIQGRSSFSKSTPKLFCK